ncbi:hypothetical protein Glove_362g30 [Diversispora epigaea]|uniref:Uncharacterized protein n=1 Tax=Diversispora epigaea TaxID=1348612 RepID=A0A397H9H3_9GLOM|nr:hypothetical protein Glove_362g30 [Diversispora epigaea]
MTPSDIRKRPRSAMPVISTENTSGFLPFWNEYTHEESKRPLVLLWIQTHGNLQSSQCLWRNITDYVQLSEGENTPSKSLKSSKKEEKKPTAGKVQRIHLYPTQNEQLKLRKWMGTVRWTQTDLRARCINVENFKNDTKLKWVIETPYPIRNEAMRDLLKGYSSNFASNKKFKMKFRSKKDPRQSIVIHFQHWGSQTDLRARCINVENFKNDTKLKWVIETPYPIRNEAMRDLLKGYSSNFASNKKFKMKFRSKKDPRQSIVIHFQHWGRSHGPLFSETHEKVFINVILSLTLDKTSRFLVTCYGRTKDPNTQDYMLVLNYYDNDLRLLQKYDIIYDVLYSLGEQLDSIYGNLPYMASAFA